MDLSSAFKGWSHCCLIDRCIIEPCRRLEERVGEGQEIDSEQSEQRAGCLVLNAHKKNKRSLEAGDVLRG